MVKLPPPEEKLVRPIGVSFFLIVSYDSEETYFKVREFAESKFSKSLYESIPLPKWMLPEEEKTIFQTAKSTRILSFEQRINREELPSVYKECYSIAQKLRKSDPFLRLFPGYLTRHNIVLASSTDDFHKIYLFHGIYAEIVYHYQRSQWIVQPSAPAFFHTREVLYFFTTLREAYDLQIKKESQK